MRWSDGIANSVDMVLGGLRELVMDRGAWCAVFLGVLKIWTRLSNWTELSFLYDVIVQFNSFAYGCPVCLVPFF